MRIMLGLTVLAAAVGLAGCKSDAAQMDEARKIVGDSCRQNAIPGVDMNRYCTCVVEKSINSKTASELRQLNEEQGKQLGMKAATECLGQVSATPANAAPVDQTGDAVEEAADEAN